MITLEYDEEIGEFGVFAMHNFENQEELKASGKKLPMRGKLRTLSSFFTNMIGYISDDSTFVYVELRQAVMMPEFTHKNSSATNHASGISLGATSSVGLGATTSSSDA